MASLLLSVGFHRYRLSHINSQVCLLASVFDNIVRSEKSVLGRANAELSRILSNWPREANK